MLYLIAAFIFSNAQDPQSLLDLGKQQIKQGQAAEARKSLAAAIEGNPKLFDAYVMLARLAQDAGDWKGLIGICERLEKQNPVDYPIAFIGQAVGHQRLGNSQAAEKNLRSAQQIDQEHRFLQSWQLLGVLLAERGDYSGAAAQWREYLKYAPPSPGRVETEARLAAITTKAEAAVDAESPTFRTETELALVRFQVKPKRGQVVSEIRKEDIEIVEDRVPQKIALLEGGRFAPRTVPLEISLLFDASGSVRAAGTLNPHVFQENLLDEYPNASIAIFGFSEHLVRLTGPTRHAEVLKKAMDAVMTIPPGGTPLFRSITETIRWPGQRPGATRMLVVFSDGESWASDDHSFVGRAIQAAQECGVAIYPVRLHAAMRGSAAPSAAMSNRDPNTPPPAWYPSATTEMSIRRFEELARDTGGEELGTFSAGDVLPRILQAIARNIQLDYVAGYHPASTAEQKRRNIEVVLKSKTVGTLVGGKRIIIR